MKKLLLIAFSAAVSFGASAQSSVLSRTNEVAPLTKAANKSLGRATAVYHDTTIMSNITSADTPALYYAGSGTFDSGYYFGTCAYGNSGFAERYDFTAADSTVQIIGVEAALEGTAHVGSTKNLVFKAWNVGSQQSISTTRFYSGFPGTQIDSVSISVDSLGITDTIGSLYAALFPTATSYLSTSFFVGCTINYNWSAEAGDTVGVYTTTIGERTAPEYTVSGTDTIINDVAVLYNAGWEDLVYDLGAPCDYYLFPIVNIKVTEGFKGVSRKNLTFYGNYPNPASDNTNIKFDLANTDDVTITISDLNGRAINTITENNLSAGTHVINVSTADLAAGNYLYLVRTASGAGIASKLTVIR